MKRSVLPILLLMLLASCKGKPGDNRTVSVSILPQKYFVERIAGDYLKVNVMIPPGMSPATYDLHTGQLKSLYNSRIYFAVGHLPFETVHLYPALKGHDDIALVNHSAGLELVAGSCCHHAGEEGGDHPHGHHAGVDPHIWLSPGYAHRMCVDMMNALSAAFPEKKAAFEANGKKLLDEIRTVGERLKEVLARKTRRSFLIYHPALTYLARDYDLEQVSIENEGKEPGPASLKRIIDKAEREQISIIFVQEEFDVGNAQAVARATGCKIIRINPLNEDWKAEMEALIALFEKEL